MLSVLSLSTLLIELYEQMKKNERETRGDRKQNDHLTFSPLVCFRINERTKEREERKANINQCVLVNRERLDCVQRHTRTS